MSRSAGCESAYSCCPVALPEGGLGASPVGVKVVEEGRRGSERGKHKRVWTRERREGERGSKIAADGRGKKKCHSVVNRVE